MILFIKFSLLLQLNILCGKRYGGVAILHLHFPNKKKSTTRARTFPKKGFARSFLNARSKFSTEFFEVCAAKSLSNFFCYYILVKKSYTIFFIFIIIHISITDARLGDGDQKIQKEIETPLANSKESIVHDDLQGKVSFLSFTYKDCLI